MTWSYLFQTTLAKNKRQKQKLFSFFSFCAFCLILFRFDTLNLPNNALTVLIASYLTLKVPRLAFLCVGIKLCSFDLSSLKFFFVKSMSWYKLCSILTSARVWLSSFYLELSAYVTNGKLRNYFCACQVQEFSPLQKRNMSNAVQEIVQRR